MLATLRKSLGMLPPAMRRRWLLLIPLALVTSAVEIGAATGLFALLTVLTDPRQGMAVPGIAAVIRYLPWRYETAVILQLTAVLALYYIAKSLLALWAQYVRVRVAHDSSAHLATVMFRRYLSAPFPFHFRRNSAELIRNCTTSISEVLGGVLGASVSIVTEVITAAGLMAVLIATSPGVSVAVAAGLLVVMVIVLRLTRRLAARRGRQSHDLSASMLKELQQAFGGIKELKVLGREGYFYEEFAHRQRQLLLLGYLGITLSSVPALVIQTVLICAGLMLVAVLSVLGRTGVDLLPVAGLFGYVGLRILPIASGLVPMLNGIRASERAVDELYEDYEALKGPDTDRAAPATAHLEFRQSIVLDAVSYCYPGSDRFAVNDVSLTIRHGESIGIVGPTGAGKSTLVDLILGLLPPTRGHITVDGVDLGSGAAPWKRRVGYVAQSLFIIDDTLRRNIALGIRDADIDDDRIRAVLAMAQLDRFVGDLPEGLGTRVGERGVRLSGGERQRVAIARALYHDPDLIVFDEATSALDNSTEAEVSRAIDALRGVKTMVVIAHRLTTVRGCDRLVWLRMGSVAGMGSFEDLRARNDEFRTLATLAAG